MLIQDWMAKDVVTVDESTSVMRASKVMKEKKVRRLPVLSHGRLTGIITDRDLKDASPSKTSTLDIHEMYYLLSEMKVKDVMTADPICMEQDESLEKAAIVMLENKISGILVVDENRQLKGLLSETDVILGFLNMCGIKDGTYNYFLEVPDSPGAVTAAITIMRDHKARTVSVNTSYDCEEGKKMVSIRIDTSKVADLAALHEDLDENFTILFHGQDDLKNLPRKKSS